MLNISGRILYIYNKMYYGRKIYNRIAVLRLDQGISRKELAEMVKVNYQTIGYLEREEYNPSLDLAFRFSEVFKQPVEFVFSTEQMDSLSNLIKNQKY